MNQIENWNGILTRTLIRCGIFSSARVLNKEIEPSIKHWNNDSAPITWTTTAEEIINKVRTLTSHMDALMRAAEITDVTHQGA
ncbi:MAG: hypothetical protein LC799_06840, partial [Actinobacteria bacterium]|nr:hypothetical protein [Actinomycetota bacterium]